MDDSNVNVLLTSFPGLGLPPTLCLPCSPYSSIADFVSRLQDRLPAGIDTSRLILTTTSNKAVAPSSDVAISSLLPEDEHARFIPLRLSVPLCGGKGGFGSQLRAAGGKMSSRRKRAQGDDNGSSRNLDGRRLRTVNEAKALAEYLAIKPDMEAKEKDARRKRWAQIVDECEKKVEEERSGKGKGRIDEQWVDDKEEAESKTRDAILKAYAEQRIDSMLDSDDSEGNSDASGSESAEEEEIEDTETGPSEKNKSSSPSSNAKGKRTVYGWDEEDDDDDEED